MHHLFTKSDFLYLGNAVWYFGSLETLIDLGFEEEEKETGTVCEPLWYIIARIVYFMKNVELYHAGFSIK